MTTANPSRLRRRYPALAAVVVAGGLALALAACASSSDVDLTETQSLPDSYHTNHPIYLQDEVATLDIPVAGNASGLTEGAKSNIQFFAQRFLASHTSVIAVVAPSGSPNQVAAAAVAVQVEDVLRKSGVNPAAIDYRVYRAGADEKIAPVRIAFNRVVADTDKCGDWSDQLSSSLLNRHYKNYGCASQQNLAAMMDNPLDLLYPRGMTPADAARRAEVLTKYRKGEATGSDTSQLKGGSVSTGVGTP